MPLSFCQCPCSPQLTFWGISCPTFLYRWHLLGALVWIKWSKTPVLASQRYIIFFFTLFYFKLLNLFRYGLPFVSPNNILVTTINGAGAVIETIYVLIFMVYAPKKEKLKIGGLLALILSVFAAVALVSYFALHGNMRKVFCGVAASVFSIIMYGSPLSIMVSSTSLIWKGNICVNFLLYFELSLIISSALFLQRRSGDGLDIKLGGISSMIGSLGTFIIQGILINIYT